LGARPPVWSVDLKKISRAASHRVLPGENKVAKG